MTRRRPTGRPLRAAGIGLGLVAGLAGAATWATRVDHPSTTLQAAPRQSGRVIDLATQADVLVVGAPQKEQLGNDLAVGDIDGDRIADVLVGAHWWTGGGRNIIGRAYLLLGRDVWPAQLDLALAANRSAAYTGRGLEARLGSSVATGDIDDDGIDDLILASVLADPSDPDDRNRQLANAGAVYIMLGGSAIAGDVDFLGAEPDIYIAGRSSSTEADRMGTYLVTGDWNDDGRTDLAVSAVFRDGFTGRVYGWWGPIRRGERIELQREEADFTIDGDMPNGFFGAAMASGDLNADGIEDLAIAALDANAGPEGAGAVHVFFGGTAFGTPRLASDANATVFGRSGMGLGSALSPGGCSCRGQAIAIADWTGDGRADLAAGATLDDLPGALNAGSAILLAGPIPSGSVELDTQPHLRLTTDEPGARFGWSLAAGDLDWDSQVDLLVAAPYSSPPDRHNSGLVYGLRGPLAASGTLTVTLESADLVVLGSQAERGTAGITVRMADTDGDGAQDLHVGIPDTAPLGRLSVGALFIVRGPLLVPPASPTPDPTPLDTATATIGATATLSATAVVSPTATVSATATVSTPAPPSPSPAGSTTPEPSPTSAPETASPPPEASPTASPPPIRRLWLPVLVKRR